MAAVVAAPVIVAPAYMAVNTGFVPTRWNNGLFSCMSNGMAGCLYAFCLPSCAMAQARTDYDGSNCLFNLCVGSTMTHNIVREGYGIQGDCLFGDVLPVSYCTPCAAVRASAESKIPGRIAQRQLAAVLGQGQWKHGFIPSPSGDCCYAYFLPNCANASSRTDYDRSNWCLNFCFATPYLVRNIVREGEGIQGNCAMDLLLGLCCPSCSICQVQAEVRAKKNRVLLAVPLVAAVVAAPVVAAPVVASPVGYAPPAQAM